MGVSLKGQRCLEDSFEDIFEEEEDNTDNEEVTEEDDNNTVGEITEYTFRDVEAEDLFILDERIKDSTKNALVRTRPDFHISGYRDQCAYIVYRGRSHYHLICIIVHIRQAYLL